MNISETWIDDFTSCDPRVCAGVISVIVLVITFLIYRRITRKELKVFPSDVVVVHKFNMSRTTPAISPYTLKLETYLRLAKIPYETVCSKGSDMSSKGKKPWISYQGQNVADSQFCIEHLNEKFGVSLNRDLTDTDKALARILRIMVEEHLSLVVGQFRWVYNYQRNKETFIRWGAPRFGLWMLQRGAQKRLWTTGMGRHSRSELVHIGKADLRALSRILGDSEYFFGNSPAEEDCAVFAILAWLLYCESTKCELTEFVNDELPNLKLYCERMKQLAWPDWDEIRLKD